MSQKHFQPDIENQNVDDIVQEILGGIPETQYVEVHLPSRATSMYGLDEPILHMRAMTFADEKAMLSVKNKNSLNIVLDRCIQEDINPRQLILQDKLYLLFHLRSLSVGDKYDLEITCGNCDANTITTVDVLKSFKVNYAENPIEKTHKFTLPELGKEVTIKRASSGDLEEHADNLLDQLWRYVLEVAGHNNAKVRAQVIEKLPRRDVHKIIEEITLPNLGVDQKFIFKCPKCSHEELKEMQLSTDFFTLK